MGIFQFLHFKSSPKEVVHPVVLISLDGWGLAPPSSGNAITKAKTPSMDSFYSKYPHGQLIASGESVGLPATEVGNSEVGHLTMGVGRVIFQSLKRINIAIENGTFYDNKAFTDAAKHALSQNSSLHLIGLVGTGNVHSSIGHLYALLQLCKKNKLKKVYLHLFTDGRDAPPNEGIEIIREIEAKLALMGIGKIASISGRYYAMDRDARWERIEQAYNAMVLGKGKTATSALSIMEESYKAGKSDEFVEPTSIIFPNNAPVTVNDNDSCIFFNFRVDRARELTMAFTLPYFEQTKIEDYGFQIKDKTSVGQTFTRAKIINNLFFVTMTEYHKNFPVRGVAFPPEFGFPDSLPEIFSKAGLRNLHLAESEKERMVTYYFRGMRSEAFPLEDIVIVPSPKVETYDKKPEMAAYGILEELKKALSKNIYRFVVINLANPDMVAHSGNIDATVKAIEIVDKVLWEMHRIVIEKGGLMLITADHGNAEELLTFPNKSFYFTTDSGDRNTDHSSNPVPIIIVSNKLSGMGNNILKGTLADIAPTILAIMKLPVPSTMMGKNLLEGIKYE